MRPRDNTGMTLAILLNVDPPDVLIKLRWPDGDSYALHLAPDVARNLGWELIEAATVMDGGTV